MIPITRDTFLSGRLKVAQPKDGYRFSIDAALLAASVRPKAGERILDLGTGCGIIPMILAVRFPKIAIHAVEIQADLAALAEKNVYDNGMDDTVSIVNADMCDLPMGEFQPPYDWICCNPPFRRAQSGRMNPNGQKAIARHEIKIDLRRLLVAASKMLGKGGRFATIYTAERAAELISEMRLVGIEPKRLQAVHGRLEEPAKLVLVHGIRGGRPGLMVPAPLIVYEDNGTYTESVAAMLIP